MRPWIVVASILVAINLNAAEKDILEILKAENSESFVQERNELSQALEVLGAVESAEQKIFQTFLSESAYEKALFQWRSAYGTDKFAKSPGGQALYAYLLWENALPRLAVDHLLESVDQPEKIHSEFRKLLRLKAKEDNQIWRQIGGQWSPKWTEFFGSDIGGQVQAFRSKNPEKIESIKELLPLTSPGTEERVWLEWQLALGLSLQSDTKMAAKVLSHMLQGDQGLFSHDLIHITIGRLLFEKGYLSPAIDYYKKIGKQSAYWFDAQEEIAWSYLRRGEPENTLAVTESLVAQPFAHHIGPEAIFTRSLAQLKICDYKGVTASIKLFRDRFRDKAVVLEKLSRDPRTPEVLGFLEAVRRQGRMDRESLGTSAGGLPRHLFRDETVLQIIKTEIALKAESQKAEKIYTKSLSGSSAEVGFQAEFQNLKNVADQRYQAMGSAVLTRVKSLAQEELDEIRSVLDKMHIVEAELIQQVNLAGLSAASTKPLGLIRQGTTKTEDKFSVVFPKGNELWFDEIDNYKVSVKADCSRLVR